MVGPTEEETGQRRQERGLIDLMASREDGAYVLVANFFATATIREILVAAMEYWLWIVVPTK